MKQGFRLPDGGLINRDKPIGFVFNGLTYTAFEGDSLASALLANNIHFVSRSFKYHRPRGIYSAGEEEPNALLEIGQNQYRTPTCRAPVVTLTEGLVARSQNGWPSLHFDLARVIDFTHPLWPAGFYNKTFKWPNWHIWEGLVRGMSGLGRPLKHPDPDRYEQLNLQCDLLICGGGPSGLMAALVAGRAGMRVILADQDSVFGGVLNWEQVELDGKPAEHWLNEMVTELKALRNVIMLPQTTTIGIYDHNVTTLLQRGIDKTWRECFWTIRPHRILLASGAIEQSLVFPNNDRPGIMLAGAIRHYLNRYAVIAGRKTVIACNNDSAYQTAIDLCGHGLTVKAIVDSRKKIGPELKKKMEQLGIPVYCDSIISNTRGTRKLKQITVKSNADSKKMRINCDLLGLSGGWAPRVHLLCHARGGLKFDADSQSFLPGELPGGFHVTGSANGCSELADCLSNASSLSMSICNSLGFKAYQAHQPVVTRDIVTSKTTGKLDIQPNEKRQWIDMAHDVTFSDAQLAVSEGFESVEHFKRYTTTGMAVDQGKTGNINAFLALSSLTGKSIEDIGTTTFRPPYMPVTLGAIAGRSQGDFYSPRRYLPAHLAHLKLNARFEDYGNWQRPDCYPVDKETRIAAINREALAVRNSVGVFDNSPIGKIVVRGPDAAEFLNRIYINNVKSLAVGRIRYGIMLNENGVIIDDGVFSRVSDNHFLVNTTSSGVSRIFAMFEELLQCDWPNLQVLVDDLSSQWANFTFAGPRARDFLLSLGTDIDLSAEALPHMALVEGLLAGERVRINRVSFSGEMSFEVNLLANRANRFLANAFSLGEEMGLTAYGIEALMVLRLEKAYLHVGSDTDGETSPDDIGWGQIWRNKSGDFLGRRSLTRPANLEPDRKQLVGLMAVDEKQVIRAGGHLLMGKNRRAPAPTDGWISSACFSPTLRRYIALGVLRKGQQNKGQIVTVIDENQHYHVKVVDTPFFDAQNERLKT